MFCSVLSAAISGVEAFPVCVEADVSDGMPVFSIVGSVSHQVREGQDRVRTALRNLGVSLPPKRITVNLAPGDMHKDCLLYTSAGRDHKDPEPDCTMDQYLFSRI